MPTQQRRRIASVLAGILALAFVFAIATGFGAAEKTEDNKSPETSGETKSPESAPAAQATPAGTPKPQFSIGPELKNRYDLTMLLSKERVAQFQYPINDIKSNIGRGGNWAIQMSIVLEFGAGTGVAESEIDDIKLREIIQQVLLDQSGQQLLTTGGKIRFTHQLISMINGILKTAGVRQIYFSEICIVRM